MSMALFLMGGVKRVPVAVAPTVTIGAVGSIEEDGTQALVATVEGGTYDSLTYAWAVGVGGGSILGNGASAIYTPADVSADTAVQAICTVLAQGTGANARAGTSDTDSDTEVFTVVRVLPVAVAPTVTIGAVGSIDEGETLTLVATLAGGTYDGVAVAWSLLSGGGVLVVDGDNDLMATYVRENIDDDTDVEVKAVVTAIGTGANARAGTSDTDSDTEVFTVVRVLPVAVAPTVTIEAVDSVDSEATVNLEISVSGGLYDSLTYLVEILSGGGTLASASGTITASPVSVPYTAPEVTDDTDAQVKCTVTAIGTGTNARNGTSDTDSDTEAFTVLEPVPLGATFNHQTITLPAADYAVTSSNGTVIGWILTPRPQINGVLTDGNPRFLRQLNLRNSDGRIVLNIAPGQQSTNANDADLSSLWETSGGFDLIVGAFSISIRLKGVDTAEPYVWIASNASAVTAFVNNVLALSGDQVGTLVLLDGTALEVEDDTLLVFEGGSIALRVRLVSEPASDVTVVATESSAVISLDQSSRTFTPDNWNVYQTFTVRGLADLDDFDNTATVTLQASGGSADIVTVTVFEPVPI